MKNILKVDLIYHLFAFVFFLAANGAVQGQETDQLIIKYKEDREDYQVAQKLQVLQRVASNYGVTISSYRAMSMGAEVFRLDRSLPDEEVENLARTIAREDSSIEYAEADALMQPDLVPNDLLFDDQWHYFETTGGIDAPGAWGQGARGSGVNVAVIDTGYRPHVDLIANILPGYDFIADASKSLDGDGRDDDATDPGDGCFGLSSSWHGTHVAGTIAARTNNFLGVAGVGYDAKIVPVRVLGCLGGVLSDIADGITWASGGNVPGVPANANRAKIINLSLGGRGDCGQTLTNVISGAINRGSLVIAAAGNSNEDASGHRPSNCDGVIGVAATDREGNKASYSNFGGKVDIAAPGGETSQDISKGVLSTSNTGVTTPESDTYEFFQGTSMAAPHVAGVAALMWSVEPRATAEQISLVLESTARTPPGSCTGCGAGIVDASRAVSSIKDIYVPLYRYWNSTIGDHTLTIDRDDIGFALFGYSFERVEAYVSLKPRVNHVPLNRYWNPGVGDSFLTTTRDDVGLGLFGYSFIREEGYVSRTSGFRVVPLSSYWNPTLRDHFLTIDRDDINLGLLGWEFVKTEGYAREVESSVKP